MAEVILEVEKPLSLDESLEIQTSIALKTKCTVTAASDGVSFIVRSEEHSEAEIAHILSDECTKELKQISLPTPVRNVRPPTPFLPPGFYHCR